LPDPTSGQFSCWIHSPSVRWIISLIFSLFFFLILTLDSHTGFSHQWSCSIHSLGSLSDSLADFLARFALGSSDSLLNSLIQLTRRIHSLDSFIDALADSLTDSLTRSALGSLDSLADSLADSLGRFALRVSAHWILPPIPLLIFLLDSLSARWVLAIILSVILSPILLPILLLNSLAGVAHWILSLNSVPRFSC